MFGGQSCYGTPRTLPVGWREPAGSFCCWANTESSAHMAPTDCGIRHSHTSTGSVHTSLQTHTCLLCFIITSLSLKRTFHTLVLTVEGVVGLMPNNITHHASASLFTSIDDGAVVVEDYSALVQSRNGVEEVKGPQIPLKHQLRTISHLYLLNLL